MERGDIVQIDGYELMAAINYVSAAGAMVLVMHNNSTHILIFVVEGSADLVGGTEMVNAKGRFIKSFEYAGVDAELCYARALAVAIGIALGELSDE